jgi:integrative and conjugative element protein (TIGR02256 family)
MPILQSQLTYDRVLIVRSVLEFIRAEVRRVGKVETGGALVGYQDGPKSLVVTNASGPGPRSELSPSHVLIDGQYADAFCTRIFENSRGRLDYVGDWHRHVGWSLAASSRDLQAMLAIKESGCCSVDYPVSAIYRLRPEHMVLYVLQGRSLKRVRTRWLDTVPHGQSGP